MQRARKVSALVLGNLALIVTIVQIVAFVTLGRIAAKQRSGAPRNASSALRFAIRCSVNKVFVEESMMLSDPDLMANIMASSPELPQCIKIYNPKTRVVVFTEYLQVVFQNKFNQAKQRWTFIAHNC